MHYRLTENFDAGAGANGRIAAAPQIDMARIEAGVSEIRRYQYQRSVPRVLKVKNYPRVLDRNAVLRPDRPQLVQGSASKCWSFEGARLVRAILYFAQWNLNLNRVL